MSLGTINDSIATSIRPRACDKAEVMQVIKTESLRGLGTGKDPVRIVKQYWSFDGLLLAENDDYSNEEKQIGEQAKNSIVEAKLKTRAYMDYIKSK